MSHLNISFADRGMMPSSLFRDSESISISKSWLPSMVCVLPDPVCPYAMMHTLYLFSEHTISSIKCWKIHTASSACLNDNKHCWLHIEVKQKYIVLILAIHHAQEQYILALRATDEVVAALYWITERQQKARPSPESVGSITSRYSGNDPTLLSRRGGTRHSGGSRGGARGRSLFLDQREVKTPAPPPFFYLSV